jgi:hypothetical protein
MGTARNFKKSWATFIQCSCISGVKHSGATVEHMKRCNLTQVRLLFIWTFHFKANCILKTSTPTPFNSESLSRAVYSPDSSEGQVLICPRKHDFFFTRMCSELHPHEPMHRTGLEDLANI